MYNLVLLYEPPLKFRSTGLATRVPRSIRLHLYTNVLCDVSSPRSQGGLNTAQTPGLFATSLSLKHSAATTTRLSPPSQSLKYSAATVHNHGQSKCI